MIAPIFAINDRTSVIDRKTCAWEKERRNRFNDALNKLGKALPCYNPTNPFSKIEILEKAFSTIIDLEEKLKHILTSPNNEKIKRVSADIITKLQERIKKLLLRNEGLCNLLRTSGIKVPREHGRIRKYSRRFLWSNSLTLEQCKMQQKKELEKENQAKEPKKSKEARKSKKTPLNSQLKEKKMSSKKKKEANTSLSRCLFIISQPAPVNNSCYIISKNPARTNQTVITNSLLVKTPIVSSNIKPSMFTVNPPLSSLGAGTLILSSGTVMPVIQTPQSISIQPNVLASPIQNNITTVIVVSSNAPTTCTDKLSVSHSEQLRGKHSSYASRPLPVLRRKKCSTLTTQVNKVPIPALGSTYNTHSCLGKVVLEISNSNITEHGGQVGQLERTKTLRKPHQNKRTQNAKLPVKKPKTSNTSRNDTTESKCNDTSIIKETQDSSLFANHQEQPEKDNTELQNNESANTNQEGTAKMHSNDPKATRELDSSLKENDVKEETNTISSNIKDITVTEPDAIDAPAVLTLQLSNSNEVNHSKSMVKSKITVQEEPKIDSLVVSTNGSISSTQITSTYTECKSTNINTQEMKALEINHPHSELSNDIFASLQVPPGCQNPESTSPTAAFLLAFPLVSSGVKVTEVIGEDNLESQAGTPNLLQIGTMDTPKSTQSHSDSLTPSFLNLDNFSFFSSKDICGSFYNSCNHASGAQDISSAPNIAITATPVKGCNNSGNVTQESLHLEKNKLNENFKSLNQNLTSCQKPVTMNVTNVNRSQHFLTNNIENMRSQSKNVITNLSQNTSQTTQQYKCMKEQTLSHKKCNDFAKNAENNLDNFNINFPQMPLNAFSSMSNLNTNYQNKNKPPENIDHRQSYINKPSNASSTYVNYKDCNSLATNSFVISNKNLNPMYTSANGNNYFYNSFGADGESKNFNTLSQENYSQYRKSESFSSSYCNNSQIQFKDKCHNNQIKVKVSASQCKPINWMTTPSENISYKPDYFLPFTKENVTHTNNAFATLPSNTYFSTPSVYTNVDHTNTITQEVRKTTDMPLPPFNSYQRSDMEENQFTWSPTKLPQYLDPSHTFVPSTLPTLVGDLALNNTPTSEQKNVKDKTRDNRRKIGNYETQGSHSNFLSVSQLVEHNKECTPAKITARRNSGNRSKTYAPKLKKLVNKPEQIYNKAEKNIQQKNMGTNMVANIFCEQKQQNRSTTKNVSSNYSAEALIGNQLTNDSPSKRNGSGQNRSMVPSFLTENVVPYYPVNVPSDNTYMPTNHSYQSNSFTPNFTTSFQNNTYVTNSFIPSACTLTTTYLPNNNFIPNSNNHEVGDNVNIFLNNSAKEKNTHKSCNRAINKDERNQNFNCKKVKKRSLNESSVPCFDIPFLSMPGANNSPILPDDFHHTTFLPPTTLYSCKNPLFPKQNSDLALIPPLSAVPGSKTGIQHPEISPVNSAGTSLTNFNLSAIFPEINKVPSQIPTQERYTNSRTKDFPVSRNFSAPTSIPVPFTSKPTLNFSSYGT